MIEPFAKLYGRRPAFFSEAPGRVNLIGEHTDYNGGFVLPTLIPQQTSIALAPRDDKQVRIHSHCADGKTLSMEYSLGEERPQKNWCDYLQGVTHLLYKEGCVLRGCDVYIQSNLPLGAGLSSSASLEVALCRVLRSAFALNLDDVKLARLCQRVENEFVGARVGIMDQMAVSLADQNHALFLDTRSSEYERIFLPRDKMDLFVINSGIKHQLSAAGGYNTRRSECEEICRRLGVRELRDITSVDALRELPDVLQRRARHVVTENQRVQEAVQAFKNKDMVTLGQLMLESHASMRDDYEVSVPGIDQLVEEAKHEPGVYGARLTGGGFGGSIVGICEPGQAWLVAPRIAGRYQLKTREKPTVLVPPPPDSL